MNLIVGGTGALGSAIAGRLLSDGEPVRVMTRRVERASQLARAGAHVVQGDLVDRESLARACDGATTVIAAAHSILGRGRTASSRVDAQGHRELIDAAKASGVHRFLYTSVYDCGPLYRQVPFFRIKHEVEEHLKSSGLSYTIIRPTAFIETHAHALIGEPILRTGKTMMFGRGEQPRNFVAADDVAEIAVRLIRDPTPVGETVDVGGPENLTNMDVVRIYERAIGKTAKVRHVPVGVARLASSITRPFHPGLSQVLLTAFLADWVDQRFDASDLTHRFGIELTRLEEWVAARI